MKYDDCSQTAQHNEFDTHTWAHTLKWKQSERRRDKVKQWTVWTKWEYAKQQCICVHIQYNVADFVRLAERMSDVYDFSWNSFFHCCETSHY